MTTDIDYIQRIIKNYERRKKLAIVFGVVATSFAVASYLTYAALDKGAASVGEFLSSSFIEGIMLTNADIQLIEKSNTLAYYYGYKMGSVINTLSIGAGIALGFCLKMMFWSKKERIIKELYEKTKI